MPLVPDRLEELLSLLLVGLYLSDPIPVLASIAVFQADKAHGELAGVGFLAPLQSLVVKACSLAAGSVLLLYQMLLQFVENPLVLGLIKSLLLFDLFLDLFSGFGPCPLDGF